MAIRIVRNPAGNCINFVGSSNPAYWNACLSAVINENDSNRIDIINDIRSSNSADIAYEFYAVSYEDFADKDGNAFANAQAAVDYINAEANVSGVSDTGTDLTAVAVNFRLDQTSTSIIMDNGSSFGVNTIKAVADADGTIHIHAIGGGLPSGVEVENDRKHFEKLLHTNVSINGSAVTGGLQDVVNALNELFTVGAFEAVVIADPYSTMVADVGGTAVTGTIVGTHGIDPVGDDIFGASSTGSLNGYKTTETIDQAGEYFTFQIRNRGQIGFGLIASDDTYTDQLYANNSNATYINPAQFGVGNNAHYGFQFSHWFHPTPNGSWTNYGANTGYVMGQAWYGANTHFEARDEWVAGTPITIRVGINENGYIHIDSLADDGTTWKQHARTSYAVREGSAYHLGIKMGDTTVRLYSTPKVHLLEPAAPTMYFRYVESPDGVYHYPVFATAEEANYYDLNHDGTVGTGTSHTEVFPDDPTQTVWYIPDTGNEEAGSAAPTGTFQGNTINWSEITTLTNSDLVPSAFSDATVAVDELTAINVQVHPQGASWTTTISDPSGNFSLNSIFNVVGTAPEVTSDNVTNPSDDYPVAVTRTNAYGSSTGTLTIQVTNLTAPAVAVSGFNWENTSTPLVDSDTLGDGSVVHMNTNLTDGKRLIFDQTWIETNVLPNLTTVGDKFFVGISNGPDWTDGVQAADFGAHFSIELLANNQMKSVISNGTTTNEITVSSTTDAYYDYAFEYDGTDLHVIACNVNAINTEPAINEGGSFSRHITQTGQSGNLTIHLGVEGGTADITATTAIDIPTPVVTNTTPWTKALNFSGSNEHLKQVTQSTGSCAIRMNGLAQLADANSDLSKTSDHTYSRPWAAAVVFQTPNNNTNQHIWNSGEGAGTNDDNIYLRMAGSNGSLYFGWGREGVGYNECLLGNFGGSYNQTSGQWWGLYVGFKGQRFNASDATAANLVNAFDFRLMGTNDVTPVFDNVYPVGDSASDWTSTGARMDRTIGGDFTIGGRGANRSFHGKVASTVVTTLRKGVTMPDDAEVKLMLTDPMKWEDDYKDGQLARYGYSGSNFTYGPSNSNSKYATQIWLMGDGTSDSYSNGIRNQVDPSDQNYTKLQLNSMVSNDIESVTIAGLS